METSQILSFKYERLSSQYRELYRLNITSLLSKYHESKLPTVGKPIPWHCLPAVYLLTADSVTHAVQADSVTHAVQVQNVGGNEYDVRNKLV